ncbi:hypothetical protein CH063_04815 [Colletotrichum higginsianum]|uniref:EC3 protein n=2 Tax=Colletotrichum higginsianum TaxID=80884 RepID=H1UWR8_COLHI|nr:EC3 protein [Colletotrichum higginsianum IMI 349063]OBR02219.1 EC3 protein [Colletotrichum higginsianum IMI 349063]CCF32419.1 hypothetical protein CH063_04815 [Colletotrichum higginsianum]CCF70875.1 EC3 protein [Colletotrichum higginsianum]
MYFTNIFVLLLALPFTTKPGCYALPANKHIGNPIHIKKPGYKPIAWYPKEHDHTNNVWAWNIAHCGKFKC